MTPLESLRQRILRAATVGTMVAVPGCAATTDTPAAMDANSNPDAGRSADGGRTIEAGAADTDSAVGDSSDTDAPKNLDGDADALLETTVPLDTDADLGDDGDTAQQPGPDGPVDGRPLRVDGSIRLAALCAGSGWHGAPLELPARQTCGPDDAGIAHAWAQSARFEHASVASFAALALELLRFGAPAELVDRTLAAARDEVRHTAIALQLASYYAGHPIDIAALELSGWHPAPSLAALAADTVRDGCVNETCAAAIAATAALHADVPGIAAALQSIAAEEATHAELAFSVVNWAIATGGETVRAAVQTAYRDRRAQRLPVDAVLAAPTVLAAQGGRLLAAHAAAVEYAVFADILDGAFSEVGRAAAPMPRRSGGFAPETAAAVG